MPAETLPCISVVIPQWGQFSLTAHAIDRLCHYESHTTEIIVIDDGSPDFDKCEFTVDQRITILRQQHQGVTSAWNRGARQARGTCLVFLNNDVLLDGPFLSRLVHPLEEEQVVMSGCCRRQERGIPHTVSPGSPRELLEGWCFAVRRIDFESIGGFDERFRLYFSDTDLQWRLLSDSVDARLEAVWNLPLTHRGHVSTRTDPQRRNHHTNDRRAFLQKWSSV